MCAIERWKTEILWKEERNGERKKGAKEMKKKKKDLPHNCAQLWDHSLQKVVSLWKIRMLPLYLIVLFALFAYPFSFSFSFSFHSEYPREIRVWRGNRPWFEVFSPLSCPSSQSNITYFWIMTNNGFNPNYSIKCGRIC